LKSDILMVHCVRMYIRDINRKILNWLIERIIHTLKKNPRRYLDKNFTVQSPYIFI